MIMHTANMGDADDSYDFLNLMPFVEKLRDGYDLVMGNRFQGGIEKGAMSWSHRYIGNPILSFVGRLFFGSGIGDFHCGLRGYNREKMQTLNLQTSVWNMQVRWLLCRNFMDFELPRCPLL